MCKFIHSIDKFQVLETKLIQNIKSLPFPLFFLGIFKSQIALFTYWLLGDIQKFNTAFFFVGIQCHPGIPVETPRTHGRSICKTFESRII